MNENLIVYIEKDIFDTIDNETILQRFLRYENSYTKVVMLNFVNNSSETWYLSILLLFMFLVDAPEEYPDSTTECDLIKRWDLLVTFIYLWLCFKMISPFDSFHASSEKLY